MTPHSRRHGGDAVAVPLGRIRSLTPMQRSLWSSQVRNPDAPLQNMCLLSHLDGPIDAPRLARAFASVVRASDVLRSRLRPDGSVVVIDVGDAAPSEIIDIDRSDARRWAQGRARNPIDATRKCHDSVVLRHEDGTTSWYLGLHHVVTDATASSLVYQATADAYAGTEIEL